MSEPDVIKYKISLIGDWGVGKTSLVRRYVHDEFDEKYLKTLGTNIYSMEMAIGSGRERKKVLLQIWDIMGQRVFKSVIKTALENTDGVLLVCDLTNLESLTNILYWIKTAYKGAEKVSFVFLGNKSDKEGLEFGLPALQALSNCFNSRAFLTSAKTGKNVEMAFQALVADIFTNKLAPHEKNFSFNVDEVKVPKLIMLEDRLFIAFCDVIGDLETGMQIIDKIYGELDLDFTVVSSEELDAGVEGMLLYLEEYQPEGRPEFEKAAKKILAERE